MPPVLQSVNFSKPVTKYSLMLRMKERVMLTFQSRFTYFKDETSSYVKRNGYIHV